MAHTTVQLALSSNWLDARPMRSKPLAALRRLYRLQRRQLLDEAQLLKDALEEHGETALVEALPMSRAGMYSRMRLLRLSPKCRAALLDGRLFFEVASAIAHLPYREQDALMVSLVGVPCREAMQVVRRVLESR